MKVLLRIAQYDLVESIKNTNTEACSDDLSSHRLSSFIFKAIKLHSSGFLFLFGQICSSRIEELFPDFPISPKKQS